MAVFRNDPEDFIRQDFHWLRDGSIHLYFRREILEDDLRWLSDEGYRICRLDASKWTSEDLFHKEISSVLDFPDYYGENLNALDDCLPGIDYRNDTGIVLVFEGYDTFAKKFPIVAWHILDSISRSSRSALLCGNRLLAKVQSDDPRIEFKEVGAHGVLWNGRESLYKSRGLSVTDPD